jgi:predicted metalloprotease with PDZ domain
MTNTHNVPRLGPWVSFLIPLLLAPGPCLRARAAMPVKLEVDATAAPRKLLHAHLTMPVAPGEVTLLYPKWIPGEHAPTGPITDLSGLRVSVEGKPLAWQRDATDMFAFHVGVPDGASTLEVALDFILPATAEGFSSGASATAQLLVVNWNQVLLYPKGSTASDVLYEAKLRLPAGWKFGTALTVDRESNGAIEFRPVSLETLVDSPVIAGANFRTVDLTPGEPLPHQIHIAADSAAALEMKPADEAAYRRLVAETGALFGARHYRGYHFLLSLSENVAHFGLEHHESSDDRAPERMLLDDDLRKIWASLLPHEMTHSWNGKYRRPAGLATPDYSEPMKTGLLWVCEGLTQYLGELLAARSGLETPETFRESLAAVAAALDREAGRGWRPLVDTAVAAQLLYDASPSGAARRRSVDFYPEGWLIWLEADVMIRQRSQGQHALTDFCRAFFGGESGPPKVVPYTFEDVVKALNAVEAYDWAAFFNARVNQVDPRAPLGGIEGGGWRLVYTDKANDYLKSFEAERKVLDLSFSLGLLLKDDGTIIDLNPDSPADKAGLAPGMKLLAVNGRKWSKELLHDAIKEAKTSTKPIEFVLENGEFVKSYRLDYKEGEKYPHLERDTAKPDLLAEILKPLAGQ